MRPVKSSSQAGFSLVETVAAMGILALAAVPLMQVSSDATRNTARLEVRLLARTVAENVIAREVAAPETIEGGISSGAEIQLGRGFVWTLTATPGVPGEVQALDVVVRTDNDPQVMARLLALKAVPLPIIPRAPSPVEGEQ